jgi:hypothetical protein
MVVNYDGELSQLTAEILREAVQVYDPADPGRWLGNPVLAAWNTNLFDGLAPTSSFAAVTGAFAAATGSFSAVTGAFAAPSASQPAPTGAFKAITGAFKAIADAPAAAPQLTLKRVFRLPSRLPGIRLPAEAELAAVARSAPTMAGLDALARWLGRDGRLVTGTDALPPADAAGAARRLGIRPSYLPFLWEYALTSGWFELSDAPDGKRSWAVIGRTAWRWTDGDDPGALRVWAAVFATVLATALDVAADEDPAAARKLTFDGLGPALAVMLFLARTTGFTLADVEDLVRDAAIGERPPARVRKAWDAWVRDHGDPAHLLLGELAALRAITPPRGAGGAIELTPLALWALREQFALDGINVPLLAEPGPAMTAAALVALSGSVSEIEFAADLAVWMRGRDPDRAAREVLAFAAFGGSQDRLDAIRVAGRLGMAAARAWRDAMQRPELRGYARIALAQLAANPASPAAAAGLASAVGPLPAASPDDLSWLATDFLTVAADPDSLDPDDFAALFARVVPDDQQAWVIHLMARSANPDVVRFLDMLSSYHPDRKVAKDARRAARAAARNRAAAARNVRVPARAAGR